MFESTGRGGFTIYPAIKGLEDLFKPTELVLYEHGNLEDLKTKIDYYLTHDFEREKIRMLGHQRTKNHHTYINRWTEILKEFSL
jgi:spore maturation protein CgeB